MNLALRIYDISPITYCHTPSYDPVKKFDFRRKARKVDQRRIDAIEKLIFETYSKSFEELANKCRKREVVKIRQISMYLLRWHADMNLEAIGEIFGGRDHTTAIHACRVVDDLMCTDVDYRNEILNLEWNITGIRPFDRPRNPEWL